MKIILTITLIWLLALDANSQSFFNELQTEFTKYKVSATDCSKINHHTGSQIFIPDNAFDLSDLESVDSVDIYYREIRNPVDMLTHQIPMYTMVMGRKLQLESTGMFELRAKVKSEDIEVHEDRSIYVKFYTNPDKLNPRTEGYQLNESKGHWENYSNRNRNLGANVNDEDLWGSSPVLNEAAFNIEDEALLTTQDTVVEMAFQAMEIFDFGIYNYDYLISGEQKINIAAEFNDQNGEPINSQVYVIYDDINTVYYFNPAEFKINFFLLMERPYALLSVNQEGKVATLTNQPDLSVMSGSDKLTYTFILERSEKVPENKEELKSIIGL